MVFTNALDDFGLDYVQYEALKTAVDTATKLATHVVLDRTCKVNSPLLDCLTLRCQVDARASTVNYCPPKIILAITDACAGD